MQNDSFSQTVSYQRKAKCSCYQTLIDNSPVCFACKGKGIKVDPLFKREKRCNTCKGTGYNIKNECSMCKNTGMVTK